MHPQPMPPGHMQQGWPQPSHQQGPPTNMYNGGMPPPPGQNNQVSVIGCALLPFSLIDHPSLYLQLLVEQPNGSDVLGPTATFGWHASCSPATAAVQQL